MKIIGDYINGNTHVLLFDNGTKIRETKDDEFKTVFPENIDYKITNKCPYCCAFCHENSVPDGLHGDIMNQKFIDTLYPGTELAIGGGAASYHPDIIPFLTKLKERGIIANMTVNQRELHDNMKLIQQLLDKQLIWGLGVSFTEANDKLLEFCKQYPNTVLHLIAGYHTREVFEKLENHNLKILILGFKNLRRGKDYLAGHSDEVFYQIADLENYLRENKNKFKTISFDNLALEQLEVKKWLDPKIFEKYFQGDDGTNTTYIDGVNEEFALSSTSEKRFKLLDNIEEMFNMIRRQ